MTIADDTDESVNDQAAVPSAYSMMDRIGGIDMKIKEKLNKKKEGLRKGKWTVSMFA